MKSLNETTLSYLNMPFEKEQTDPMSMRFTHLSEGDVLNQIEYYLETTYKEEIANLTINYEYVYNCFREFLFSYPISAYAITVNEHQSTDRFIDISINLNNHYQIESICSISEINMSGITDIYLPFDLDYVEAVEFVCRYGYSGLS